MCLLVHCYEQHPQCIFNSIYTYSKLFVLLLLYCRVINVRKLIILNTNYVIK